MAEYRRIMGPVVFTINKCASDAIVGMSEASAPLPAITFIRDPIDRAVSGFQFFLPHPLDERHAPTWEIYVDRILARTQDDHWTPQAQQLAGICIRRFHAFEEIGKVIPIIGHTHRSIPVRVNRDYRLAELKVYYAADYELRARCGI